MIDTTDPSSLEGVMHRALVRTGYKTLFRGAELRALEVGDLSRRPDGGYDIHLRQSKTDQAWSGFWTVVSTTCAELLDTWITRAGLDSGYVFLQCRQDQYLPKPLSSKAHRIIYRACGAGGVLKRGSGENRNPFDASGVCPRHGAAWLFVGANHATRELVQFRDGCSIHRSHCSKTDVLNWCDN